MKRSSVHCKECRDQSGPLNPHWKGGKSHHKAGYVMRRATAHPRSSCNNGYVFEHILVMEGTLGRHLLSGETVHHINGVKDDNRSENLELWTRPQPAGCRVEDLVMWATELLRTYAPDILA